METIDFNKEKAPKYIRTLQRAHPKQRTRLGWELFLSRDATARLELGTSASFHRRRAMELMWPERSWHAWREERMESVQQCLNGSIKELMWIGSSNSNKSADMADTALGLWWAMPEMTSIYVTSPYETATELGLWAYIQEQFAAAKERHEELPGKVRYSDNSIVLYDRNPRSFIRLATVDQVGKLVGKKSRDFEVGLLVILADELPAFTAMAGRNFLKTTPNLWSVPNLLIIGAGNFASTSDALGVMCDPDEKDIPNGYEGFDPDRHFRWRTKRGGLCLRFDGLQSPNVKAGADKWPFVTTLDYIKRLAALPGGLQSPDAMRFVRSAPITSLNEFTVTNGERIRAGGCYDPFEWKAGDRTRVAFVDPGFGGDPCVMQAIEFGWQTLESGARRQVLSLLEAPITIPIVVGKKDEEGKEIPVEDQIVDGAKAECRRLGIPPEHVGYDGSLRASIGAKFASRWSPQTIPIDSQGPATDRKVSGGNPKLWKEEVDRFVSEMWFAVALVIDGFQLRNLQLSPKAAAQLCSRPWMWAGKKKKAICTKLEYKEAMKAQGKNPESPNEADALVGAIEIARRLGFTATAGNTGGGSMQTLLTMIREKEARSTFLTLQRSSLKSGKLNVMTRPTTDRESGKLHVNARR